MSAAALQNRYSGEKRNQVRHGRGSYMYENAFFKYEGDWKDGVKHGRGKLLLGDGGYYEGSFVNGEMSGHGHRVFGLSGASYSGQFQRGEMWGQGLLCSADGEQYEGELVANRKEGEGILSALDGSVYEGSFHDNKRHGEGLQVYSNGDRFEGNWVRGQRQGHGVLQCSDGTVYEGQWRSDQFHGEGTMSHSSGMMYSGMWASGRPAEETTRLAFAGTELTVHQGEVFSVEVECLKDNGATNHTDTGRVLKVSAWTKSAPDIPLGPSHSTTCHSSVGQQLKGNGPAPRSAPKDCGHLHAYELLQDPPMVESRCHSTHLPSRPATVTEMREMDPNEGAVGKKATTQLAVKSFVAPGLQQEPSAEELFLQRLVPPGSVTTCDGKAVFKDLYLPPPTLPGPMPHPGGGEEGAEPGVVVKHSKHKLTKDKSCGPANAQTYCPAGTYLLSVEDVTDPPFLNEHAETCFVKVKVLPKQSN